MKDGLLKISDKEPDFFGGGLIIADGKPLNDEAQLQAMAGMPRLFEGKWITSVAALNAIIAQAILDLQIEKGAPLVQPTSAMIQRNMRRENPVEPGKPIREEDDTLFFLRKNLLERPDLETRFRVAVALGDESLHAAAGIGHKHLRRMGDPSYPRKMAEIGYSTALDMAEAAPEHPRSWRIKSAIPEVARRPEAVIEILRLLVLRKMPERISISLN